MANILPISISFWNIGILKNTNLILNGVYNYQIGSESVADVNYNNPIESLNNTSVFGASQTIRGDLI